MAHSLDRGIALVVVLTPLAVACGDSGTGAGGAGTGTSTSQATGSTSSASSSTTAQSSSSTSASATSSTGSGVLTQRRVFITSGTIAGNLGLAAMEAFCQSSADAASLGGTWQAWVGMANDVPDTRFTHGTIPYVLVSGTQIATDWTDLVDGNLATSIGVDEHGTALAADSPSWTGVGADGTTVGGTCNGWATTTGNGWYGSSLATNSEWSFQGPHLCSMKLHLYCFEK